MSDRTETVVVTIIIAFFAVLLIVCLAYVITNNQHQAQIVDGVIIDKHYFPPTSGKYEHDAEYTVTVQNDEGIEANYAVTPLLYDRLNIGDYIKNVNQALK